MIKHIIIFCSLKPKLKQLKVCEDGENAFAWSYPSYFKFSDERGGGVDSVVVKTRAHTEYPSC